MALGKSLRFQVFRRDGHVCQYCGGRPPDVALVVDHVVPAALGGSDDPENLVTSCRDCNSGKAATPPDAPMVAAVGERERIYADEMARLARDAELERDGLQWMWDAWASHGAFMFNRSVLPANWESTVLLWLRRGLTRDDILYATDVAWGNPTVARPSKFAYAAGICWRMLRQREDIAAESVRTQRSGGSADGEVR